MEGQVTDEQLVLAARAGEADALAELYDRYFAALYDFLARMLLDRHAAADVAQDSFLRAMERLGQLRKPARFRSWLFSIGYRLGIDHANQRTTSRPAEPADPILIEVDPDRLSDPEEAARAADTGRFVWEMAEGLDPRSYAVMHLHVRQGMSSAEIADVLGVSKGNAYTMVSRMKSTLGETIGAYLLLRRGTEACPDLAALAAAAPVPPMTRELRRRVERHVGDCDECTETKAALLAPSAIFGSLVMVPLPVALSGAVLGAASTAVAGGAAGAAAGAASGSGVVRAARNNPGATAAVAAAAVLAAVLAAFQFAGAGEPPAEPEVLGVTLEQEGASDEVALAAPPPPAPAPERPATAPSASSTTTSSSSSTTTTPPPAAAAPAPTTTTTRPARITTTTAPPTTTSTTPAVTSTTAPPPTAPPTTTAAPTTTTAPPTTTTTIAALLVTPTTTTAPPTTTTTVPPARNPPDLSSGSHPIGVPWVDRVVVVRWTPVDGSGGYSVSWSGDPTGSPDTVADLPGSAGEATSPVLTPGTWYFHLRTQGPGGDWAATVHVGPFVIVAPPAPPVIGAVHVAPPTIQEQGCSPSSANVIANGIADPDGDLAAATLTWSIAGAGRGTAPVDLREDTAKGTLAYPAGTIGPAQSPAVVTVEVTITDAAGLSATASSTLLLVDCP